MNKTRIALGGTFLLLLLGCSGSGINCDETVKGKEYSICLLSDWEQVPEETLRQEGVPEETLAAFQMKVERGGQRDNVVITKERVKSGVTSMQYAEVNIKIVDKTPEYSAGEKREVEIDGDKTLLHIFTARPVQDLPARRFYQVSAVKGTTGYVVTGTLPFTVDEETEAGIIAMVTSASFEVAE